MSPFQAALLKYEDRKRKSPHTSDASQLLKGVLKEFLELVVRAGTINFLQILS